MLIRRAVGGARRADRLVVPWACLAVVLGLVTWVAPAAAGGTEVPPAPVATDPASSVDPFIGTGFGPGQIGAIGMFPGADLPFGMLQWSPDTPTDNEALEVSGGYYSSLDTMDGFSLTHLSGAGCTALEDFPVVPYAGAVTVSPYTDPNRYETTFSHERESAAPGYYSVTLSDGVKVELTVTDRTGIGRFTFPRGVTPTILVDPEASQGAFVGGSCQRSGRTPSWGLPSQVTSATFPGITRSTSSPPSSPRSTPSGPGRAPPSPPAGARAKGRHPASTPPSRRRAMGRPRSP